MYIPGATGKITKDEISSAEEVIMNASIFYCTFECSMDITIHALKIARKNSGNYSLCTYYGTLFT